MARFKIQKVLDLKGDVLHLGDAKSLRGFIEKLVASGENLDGANLRGLDLSGLVLDKMVARGACFDGADLRGSQLRDADLTSSTFRSFRPGPDVVKFSRLDGCNAEGAVFDHSDLTEASFGGARMARASVKHAVIDRTSFTDVTGSSMSFIFASGSGSDFGGARLVNADWAYCRLVEPNFKGANLSHWAFGGKTEDRQDELSVHLPDRTRGATIIAGAYDRDTVFASTVPKFRADARTSRFTRMAIAASTMIGLVAATQFAEPYVSIASHALGDAGLGAVAVVGTVSAIQFAQHTAVDWMRDKTGDALAAMARQVRRTVSEMERRGAERLGLVCAMARDNSIEPLRLALAAKAPEAKERGIWSLFKSFVSDIGHVIVCDRQHLALALGTLALHNKVGMPLPHDVTIIRQDYLTKQQADGAPQALRFLRDGRSVAVWIVDGTTVTVRYNTEGVFESCWDAHGHAVEPTATGLPVDALLHVEAAIMLENAALADHGLGAFRYPRETCELRDGHNGSILVRGRSDRLIGNPEPRQPAIIGLHGEQEMVHHGRRIVHQTAGDEAASCPVRHLRRLRPADRELGQNDLDGRQYSGSPLQTASP
jgi:hypothetical protein